MSLLFQLLVLLHVCHRALPIQLPLPGCHHGSMPGLLANRTSRIHFGTSHRCSSDFIPYLQCPVRQEYSSLGLRERSTCPWVMCHDVDPLRDPHDIFYAKCLCVDCTGRSANHACQAVYQTISVKRITGCNETGAYIFTLHNYRLAVGCTCARKRI